MGIKKTFKGFRVVDIVALSIFLGIMAVSYFFLMRKADYVDVVLRVSQSDLINTNTGGVSATLPAWYLENFKVDNIDGANKSSISIVKVYEYQNNSNEKIVYLTLRLLTVFDRKTGIYTYDGLPLLVGNYVNFRYKGIMLRGIVQKVGGSFDQKREEKTLMVEGRVEAEDYLAKSFIKGLTISDSDDQVMAKIEGVEVVPIVGNKTKKIVKLRLRVKVLKFSDVYLYAGEQTVKIGEELNLDFWSFNAKVLVTNFEEISQ